MSTNMADGEKFLKCRVDARDLSQRRECAAIRGMDVLVFVEPGKLFVGSVRK